MKILKFKYIYLIIRDFYFIINYLLKKIKEKFRLIYIIDLLYLGKICILGLGKIYFILLVNINLYWYKNGVIYYYFIIWFNL